MKKQFLIFFAFVILSTIHTSCVRNGDVFLRVENLRDYKIEDLQIGEYIFGDIEATEISEYQQVNTGTFKTTYYMNGDFYSGEVETWGTGNLKMQIENNGDLDFKFEGN